MKIKSYIQNGCRDNEDKPYCLTYVNEKSNVKFEVIGTSSDGVASDMDERVWDYIKAAKVMYILHHPSISSSRIFIDECYDGFNNIEGNFWGKGNYPLPHEELEELKDFYRLVMKVYDVTQLTSFKDDSIHEVNLNVIDHNHWVDEMIVYKTIKGKDMDWHWWGF